MIYGVFVPAGNLQGSEIIPFSATIVPAEPGRSEDRVDTSNFDAHTTMQASLRTARQACEGRLSTISGVWEAVLLPSLAGPLNRRWQVVAVVGFLGGGVISVVTLLWLVITVSPPSALRFAWLPFLAGGLALLGAALLSLPLRSMINSVKPSRRRNLKELHDFLYRRCFQVQVGDGERSNRIFSGPSAGLTLFCAFVEAVKESGQQETYLPWEDRLVAEMSRMVASVDLRDHGRFARLGNAPEFPHKIEAIWSYTQDNQDALALAVFSTEDFADVRREWSAHAQETLQLSPVTNRDYITANSDKARLGFLFCDDLKDFLHYLHPWERRWLTLRGVSLLLLPILAIPVIIAGLSVTRYSPPEFVLECVPACHLIGPGVYSTKVPPGKGSTVHIEIGARGAQGNLHLSVESNYDKTLSPTIDGALGRQFSRTIAQDTALFFLRMPQAPSGEEVAVVVSLTNQAGKYAQASILFAPGEEPN